MRSIAFHREQHPLSPFRPWAYAPRLRRGDRCGVKPSEDPSEQLPVIADAHLNELRAVAKPVPFEWISCLMDMSPEKAWRKGSCPLPDPVSVGPVSGTMRLFSREDLADPLNWSVGLAFTDDDGNEYRLIRCNGFHGAHKNKIEQSKVPSDTPHVHFATERYTARPECRHDGFAEIVGADDFTDLRSAIDYLADAVNLVSSDNRWLR